MNLHSLVNSTGPALTRPFTVAKTLTSIYLHPSSLPILLTLLTAGTRESRGAHTLAIQVMADTSMQAAWAFLGTVWSPAPCPTA